MSKFSLQEVENLKSLLLKAIMDDDLKMSKHYSERLNAMLMADKKEEIK